MSGPVDFSSGFRVRDGRIAIDGAAPLDGDAAWNRHLPLLGAARPAWSFAPGLGVG